MAGIFERLDKTGALLSSAIDQYLDACVAIGGHPRLSFAGVSRVFFDRVASELPLAILYETKIKQAKAIMRYTMNSSSPIPHVNSLPPEILTRIFHMVTDTCGLMRTVGNSIPLPRYPDYLSHVCTRWRQVALGSPRLWTHIDLVRLSVPNHGFKPRAETFVSRAGSCLLDVQIYEQPDCYTYDHQSMLDVVTRTMPQTRSLELVAPYIPGYGQRPRLLEHFLNNFEPQTLTKLDITELSDPNDGATQSTHFIDGHSHSSQTPEWPNLLDISAERLGTLLLPVTHLKLDGVYFPGTHRAYHGLVELRLLVNNESGARITRLELKSILAASPRLKLLHFEIKIVDNPMGSFIAPVRLDNLEALKLRLFDDGNLDDMLSLLATGPKPLRFSFAHDYLVMNDPQEQWLVQIKDFFKRSHITELRLQNVIWPPHVGPENLLESLPNLRVLALESCANDPHSFSQPFPPLDPNLPHLDAMYVIKCVIQLGQLAQTLKHLRVGLVVFWGCKFPEGEGMAQYREDDEAIKVELAVICPSFIWIDTNEPNPIEHWD